MGQVTEASCKSCGYFRSVSIGGVRSESRSSWPVYCDACQTMRTANVRCVPLACDYCHSEHVTKYDARTLVIGGTETVSEWSPDRLTDGLYFCPKCEKHELKFSHPVAFFD